MKLNKRVGIIGWFNHPNFGDQLLFNILYEWTKQYDESLSVVIPWGSKQKVDWPDDLIEIGGEWKALRSCDVVIFGGGGYFGEPGEEAIRRPTQYSRLDRIGLALHLPDRLGCGYFGPKGYLRAETQRFIHYGFIAKILSLKNIPYCVLGTGLGPVTTKLGRWGVKSVLAKAESITLRDCESAAFAKELCNRDDIVASVDMVLSQCVPCEQVRSRRLQKIAVHLGPGIAKRIDVQVLIGGIERLLDDGFDVSVISDCNPPGHMRTTCPKEIIDQFGDKIDIVPYSNVSNFLDTLSNYDAVLTSKLHVGIVAYTRSVLPVSIAEHTKTQRFYSQAGLEELSFSLSVEGISNAIKCIESLKKDKKKVKELLCAKREEIFSLAIGNKEILKKFFENSLF